MKEALHQLLESIYGPGVTLKSSRSVGGGSINQTQVLTLSNGDFAPVARVMAAVYLPLAAVEAAVTAFAVGFLVRVQPGALAPLAVRA